MDCARRIGVLLAALITATAHAETYSSRPVTMVVGFPPGGPTDAVARILASGMQAPLGQPVVIENITGAGGTIATARVVHANPDGYTIGIGNWTSHVGSPAIFDIQYDVLKDLQPIALVAAAPLWIIGKNDLPAHSVAELVSWLRSHPSSVSFATVGAGSGAHICGLYFAQKLGLHFQFVPYRGAGPIIQDMIAGHIDLSCLDTSSTIADVEAGKFKAFVIMSEKRTSQSPETPTMAETGAPGASVSFWHGLWATSGTPQAVVDRLAAAVNGALADPQVRKRLEAVGQVIAPREDQTPAALASFHKAEIDKWWPLVRAAGIKSD